MGGAFHKELISKKQTKKQTEEKHLQEEIMAMRIPRVYRPGFESPVRRFRFCSTSMSTKPAESRAAVLVRQMDKQDGM